MSLVKCQAICTKNFLRQNKQLEAEKAPPEENGSAALFPTI